MRFFVVTFLVVVMIFLASQFFALNNERGEYVEQVEANSVETRILEIENKELKEDLEFYQDDKNLSKELRAQFNYHEPGEELLILVPGKEE
ncbi:MAG: hypothetical protein COU10_00660 [Candidatus Harrisonbacteria bacterium CG10_big_fil_rev_8_21_14_0_10_45_28]|uniref:Septum formation initiator n=1 Tax=Candidatus Harrisonbacteria bacterium CG10_big_fil_rev_8_21_14_0_10_45_28 TaxID=1974586 RepID=A0A2H0UP67_9BACT|nr:MAG: hypothetical protein COU10_00660 [Candidatus Harrisonbacteria bacterium CG10_big_fil_rev_8_21_14_0_10_45_28]